MIPTNINRQTKLADCKRQETEEAVQNDLAITPGEMYALAQQGKPITTHQLPDDYFDDGDARQTYDMPIDRLRGIDVIDCWNASKDSKNKLKSFTKSQRDAIQQE